MGQGDTETELEINGLELGDDPRVEKYEGEYLRRISDILPDLSQEQISRILPFAMQLAQEKIQAEDLADHDQLTGLLNRRGFFKLFDLKLQEFKRNAQSEPTSDQNTTPGSVLVIDLDNFGLANKKMGELFGDKVLQEVAKALTEGVRPGDLIVRFGGEEFLIFLSGAILENAAKVTERLHAAIPTRTSNRLDGFTQTASIGVVQLPDKLTDQLDSQYFRKLVFTQTYNAADEAMRQAKQQGKNQIVVIQSSGATQNSL